MWHVLFATFIGKEKNKITTVTLQFLFTEVLVTKICFLCLTRFSLLD